MGVGWGQYCGTRLKYCQQCSVSFKIFNYHTVDSSDAYLCNLVNNFRNYFKIRSVSIRAHLKPTCAKLFSNQVSGV